MFPASAKAQPTSGIGHNGTMDWSGVWEAVLTRLTASVSAQEVPTSPWLASSVLVAALAVLVGPAWTVVRPVVTVVHELGHAVVGVVCGRRFTGFVVNSDMSGHTVTVGRSRGVGLVLTTLAGYPMPAVVGALGIAAAMGGRAHLVLLIALVLLLVALVRSRSAHTVAVLVLLLSGTGVVWWQGSVELASTLVAAVSLVLLVGAWRQFLAVVLRGDRRDDPGALSTLTRVPAVVWNLVMLALIAAPTWWSLRALSPVLREMAALVVARA